MAAGDAFGFITNISASSNLDYQPAAGVEICVTAIAMSESSNAYVRLYDGTINADLVAVPSSVNGSGFLNTKIIITNSIYLRLRNSSTGTRVIGLTGLQLK